MATTTDNVDSKHLLDELRYIEGFPLGEDEDLRAHVFLKGAYSWSQLVFATALPGN